MDLKKKSQLKKLNKFAKLVLNNFVASRSCRDMSFTLSTKFNNNSDLFKINLNFEFTGHEFARPKFKPLYHTV